MVEWPELPVNCNQQNVTERCRWVLAQRKSVLFVLKPKNAKRNEEKHYLSWRASVVVSFATTDLEIYIHGVQYRQFPVYSLYIHPDFLCFWQIAHSSVTCYLSANPHGLSLSRNVLDNWITEEPLLKISALKTIWKLKWFTVLFLFRRKCSFFWKAFDRQAWQQILTVSNYSRMHTRLSPPRPEFRV